MKALFRFLRSVLPADLFQLMFLTGIVCLIITPRLRWWPAQGLDDALRGMFDVSSPDIRLQWRLVLSVSIWPIIFSGLAGYFACFWPGKHPVRRIAVTVFFPALFVLLVVCLAFIYLTNRPVSVLQSTSDIFVHARFWPRMLWNLGPGLHFCLLGAVLVGAFVFRCALGKSSLPLAIGDGWSGASEGGSSWEHPKRLIWIAIGPFNIFAKLAAFFVVVLPLMSFHAGSALIRSVWFSRTATVIDALLILIVAFWVIGAKSWRPAWQLIHTPLSNDLLLGAVFPIGVSLAISIAGYLVARIQWAAGNRWYAPPEFASYFAVPDVWLLLMLFAAFAEEIVFRGLIQQRMIERYGTFRGIFLVGVTWGAFHFPSDSYLGTSDFAVAVQLSYRVGICLAFGFVLSWLTLRSGSVIPAAIAHTLSNILILSEPNFPGYEFVRLLLWASLGYVLFRYWPVSEAKPSKEALSEAAPQAVS